MLGGGTLSKLLRRRNLQRGEKGKTAKRGEFMHPLADYSEGGEQKDFTEFLKKKKNSSGGKRDARNKPVTLFRHYEWAQKGHQYRGQGGKRIWKRGSVRYGS